MRCRDCKFVHTCRLEAKLLMYRRQCRFFSPFFSPLGRYIFRDVDKCWRTGECVSTNGIDCRECAAFREPGACRWENGGDHPCPGFVRCEGGSLDGVGDPLVSHEHDGEQHDTDREQLNTSADTA